MSGLPAAALRLLPVPGTGGGVVRSLRMVERSVIVYRRRWPVLASGAFEPLFYLLALGVGLGSLVGKLPGPAGHTVRYVDFVAPAMLAAASMNGAIFDSTFNVYFKLRFDKVYDAALATPLTVGSVALGEITWALIRGGLYAASFVVVLLAFGLIHSAWAVLALPAALLIGFAFAATGMACTTFMRSWQDFDYVTMVQIPLFLFSATFYPLSVYPAALRVVVECTPLYQGVTLLRGLTLGGAGPGLLPHAAYLLAMGLVGAAVATRRLGRILLR
jgi:lipooligosaccharide transport system permease protein